MKYITKIKMIMKQDKKINFQKKKEKKLDLIMIIMIMSIQKENMIKDMMIKIIMK